MDKRSTDDLHSPNIAQSQPPVQDDQARAESPAPESVSSEAAPQQSDESNGAEYPGGVHPLDLQTVVRWCKSRGIASPILDSGLNGEGKCVFPPTKSGVYLLWPGQSEEDILRVLGSDNSGIPLESIVAIDIDGGDLIFKFRPPGMLSPYLSRRESCDTHWIRVSLNDLIEKPILRDKLRARAADLNPNAPRILLPGDLGFAQFYATAPKDGKPRKRNWKKTHYPFAKQMWDRWHPTYEKRYSGRPKWEFMWKKYLSEWEKHSGLKPIMGENIPPFETWKGWFKSKSHPFTEK